MDNFDTKQIAKKLKNNQSLKILNFSRNQIGDKGSKAFAKALNSNKTLVMLDLSKNQIRDQGVFDWHQTLNLNEQLELNLNYNEIELERVKTLARLVEKNPNLENLSLGKNQIGDEGLIVISGALEGNDV